MLEVIATLSAGLFAAAAIYISFVEHRARMECGTAVAMTHFAPSYRRATLIQAPLALLGLVAGLSVALIDGTVWWAAGGLLLGSVVPLTLVVILPTNKQLLDDCLDKESARASELLTRRGRPTPGRGLLGAAAVWAF